jgi:hypothetical protein
MKIIGILITTVGIICSIALGIFFIYRKNRSQYVWNKLTNWLFNLGNKLNRYYLHILAYLKKLFYIKHEEL